MLRDFVGVVTTKNSTAEVLKSLSIGNEVAILTGGKTIQYAQNLLDKKLLTFGDGG